MGELSHKRANLLLQGVPHANDRPVEQLEQRPTCRGHVMQVDWLDWMDGVDWVV